MSQTQYIPGYTAKLDLRQTQKAIKVIKDTFQVLLAQNLHLERVTAPVLVTGGSTMNIFGGGTLLTTGTGSASMLTGALTVFNGTVNVYDVTIQGTEAVPAVTTQFAQATVNLLEGSEAKGAVNVNNGNVTLAGSA